ncbi:unnamed protein product [Arctogadus glacialis]
MAPLAVCMKSILLIIIILSNASSIDGNYSSYNSSVELNIDGNFKEELLNSSTTEYELSEITSTPAPGTDVSLPGTDVSPPGTDVPLTVPEPLPLSGRLPTGVPQVGRLCPCDKQRDACDLNCCCDPQCGGEAALFTHCSISTVSGNQQLCQHDVVHYSLGKTGEGFSTQDTFIQKYVNADIFCIHSQNNVESLSYSLPAVPTDTNFDSLFKAFEDLPSSSGSDPVSPVSPGYQYGDVIDTLGENGERGILQFPAAAVNTNCLDTNPAAFLKQQVSRCTISMVVDRDCSKLQALHMITYTGLRVLSGKNENATVVAVVLTSANLKSLEETLSPVELGPAMTLEPTLVNSTLCLNVVQQVSLVVKYNPAGEIVNVSAALVLGPVSGTALSLELQFGITFVQEEDGQDGMVQRSGNPGYVTGLPSSDPRGTLSILQGGREQDCLRGAHARSPVLFAQAMVSGCTLKLEEGANCTLVSDMLLEVLRGSAKMQYVAAFGTTTLDGSLDWVPLETVLMSGEAQSCIIPLSHHLEIQWTKYGSLENAQARIVSIKEFIHNNSSNMALLFGGSTSVTVTSSVSFVSVSTPSEPGFQAPPTIDAKLPFEFFFPFT